MAKNKFKLGDRVYITDIREDSEGVYLHIGDSGRICTDWDCDCPGVEFDRLIRTGSDLLGTCKEGYGRYIASCNLEHDKNHALYTCRGD